MKCSFMLSLTLLLIAAGTVYCADQKQWGHDFSRNMISGEENLADNFDPDSGLNIRWSAQLGSETWATPTVAFGKVYIGTNNNPPRDPRHKGDRGILLCLDEKTGDLIWQLVVPKLGPDPYLDWPRGGIVSPITAEGDRAYTVTNRGEVVCLDIHGQADGNDGPYKDEGVHMGIREDKVYDVTSIDADIIWLFDIPNQAGTYPHDSAHSSILIDGDFMYVNTSNGVDNTHRKVRKPDGPSLIVLDKKTGRLLARDYEGIGPRIFHSTWSSPAMGYVNGRKLLFFGGGDGVMYAFEALSEMPEKGNIQKLQRIWKFDCDPTGPKENVSEYLRNRRESPSNIKGMPVFYDGKVYVAVGGDIWWGKRQAWLKCIDASKSGDVTKSGAVWSYDLTEHCCSTPSIYNGMAFITDCGGMVHCIDLKTGRQKWSHDAEGEMWASTLVADGKVYAATRKGYLWIFDAAAEKKIVRKLKLDSGIAGTPVAANNTLYITTMHKLYAVKVK